MDTDGDGALDTVMVDTDGDGDLDTISSLDGLDGTGGADAVGDLDIGEGGLLGALFSLFE